MNNPDLREPVSCDDDDLPPSDYKPDQNPIEVKKKPLIPYFHIIFIIILGSICILLGIIDMIVFYVVPNNQINKNKKKYKDFEFEKPNVGIIVIHFLLHVNLIIIGALLISSINDKFCQSVTFLLLISLSLTIFCCFYITEAILTGSFTDMIKKEDFTLDRISELLNSTNPIDSVFLYVKGQIRGRKGSHKTCYSKNGFSIPIRSTLISSNFDPKEYLDPDYFYLKITQKVNMTDQLFLWVAKSREKLISCENKHSSEIDYYPRVEGRKLILSKGKKIPSKMKKSNSIASLLFGLGIYPELLTKSIPIKSYDQFSNVDVVEDFDYRAAIEAIDCSHIGKCKSGNDRPHM